MIRGGSGVPLALPVLTGRAFSSFALAEPVAPGEHTITPGWRAGYPLRVPLVLGTPLSRGSGSTAMRRARAAALKIASLM